MRNTIRRCLLVMLFPVIGLAGCAGASPEINDAVAASPDEDSVAVEVVADLPDAEIPPEVGGPPAVTIPQLRDGPELAGRVEVTAYYSDSVVMPPCPEGLECEHPEFDYTEICERDTVQPSGCIYLIGTPEDRDAMLRGELYTFVVELKPGYGESSAHIQIGNSEPMLRLHGYRTPDPQK